MYRNVIKKYTQFHVKGKFTSAIWLQFSDRFSSNMVLMCKQSQKFRNNIWSCLSVVAPYWNG